MGVNRKFKRDQIRNQAGNKKVRGYYQNMHLADQIPVGYLTSYAYSTKNKINKGFIDKIISEGIIQR